MILILFLIIFIAIIIFSCFLINLFIKLILNRFKVGKTKQRNYLSFFFTLTTIALIAFAFIKVYVSPIDFESSQWKEDKTLRHRMTIDIIKSEILIGKTREEVIKILGSEYKSAPSYLCKNGLNYKTHSPYDFGIDHEALIICFKDNNVVRVTVELI